MSAANTYLGDCSWQPINDPQVSSLPNDLPILIEVWLGREDLAAAWQALHPIGQEYLGGYVIDNTPRPHSPAAMICELKVALPPDFTKYLLDPSRALKTATKTAVVESSDIIPGGADSAVNAVRNVTFYAPEGRYQYFASAAPSGPRFSSAGGTAQPAIIRSVITATGQTSGTVVTFAGTNAPSALVSALTMNAQDYFVDLDANQIKGTPWYECRECWSRQQAGDELS